MRKTLVFLALLLGGCEISPPSGNSYGYGGGYSNGYYGGGGYSYANGGRRYLGDGAYVGPNQPGYYSYDSVCINPPCRMAPPNNPGTFGNSGGGTRNDTHRDHRHQNPSANQPKAAATTPVVPPPNRERPTRRANDFGDGKRDGGRNR